MELLSLRAQGAVHDALAELDSQEGHGQQTVKEFEAAGVQIIRVGADVVHQAWPDSASGSSPRDHSMRHGPGSEGRRGRRRAPDVEAPVIHHLSKRQLTNVIYQHLLDDARRDVSDTAA